MGRLTTHVLDTMKGGPAAGVAVTLHRVHPNGRREALTECVTNADGRTDRPMLADDAFKPGVYELDFAIGAYFRASGVSLPEPPFLDVVPLRFGIADAGGHYHVPLLASPWSYSTYRGS